ncbi:MAG: 50S ribosomal protein L16 [Nanoarchaeota archaeon]
MAKLMRAVAWRRLERPYTRKSKFRAKAFVKAVPASRIAKHIMGETSRKFQYSVMLCAEADVQIRHNALESGRKSTNKILENKIGKVGYMFRLRVYPHHVLRNNPLASGAGADRMSTGMKMSFGKTVGIAAQLHKGQPIFEVQCDKDRIAIAKEALLGAKYKVPCSCSILVQPLK